jgi:integrase
MNNLVNDFSENIISDFFTAKQIKKINIELVDFPINQFVKFRDNYWDFNHLNTYQRDPSDYRFDFNSIPLPFRYYSKLIVLDEILLSKNKYKTAKKVYDKLKTISRYLNKKGITDVRLVRDLDIREYVNNLLENNKPSYISTMIIIIRKFLILLEETNFLVFNGTIQYLEEVGSICAIQKPDSTINEYIPDAFLNKLVSLAVRDIENSELSVDERVFACLLIILAETGMRAEELCLLQTNQLNKIKFEDKVVNYLTFFTFKTKQTISEAKETYTYMSPLATKAYCKAEFLVNKIITKFSTQIEEKEIKKNVSLLETAPFFTNSNLEIKRINKHFIFISSINGKLRRGTTPLREHYQRFIIRHYKNITLDLLTAKEKNDINYFQIKVESKYEKFIKVVERKIMPFAKVKTIKFPHVNLHRFRVTVCTKLFRQKVHLDYIVKHMNHLSEEMTLYYNKSHTFKDELKESIEILSSIINNEGLIETDKTKIQDQFLKAETQNQEVSEKIVKVNDFLMTNKINIKNDIKKVYKIMEKTNSSIAENEFGMCMRSLIHGLCERKKYFSTMNDGYFIGIQLQNYKFFDYNYERFKQKLEVVNHNKKIAEIDSRYINEYQREEKALKGFVSKTLVTELELLQKDLNAYGEKYVLENHPRLNKLLIKIGMIGEEIEPWIV